MIVLFLPSERSELLLHLPGRLEKHQILRGNRLELVLCGVIVVCLLQGVPGQDGQCGTAGQAAAMLLLLGPPRSAPGPPRGNG